MALFIFFPLSLFVPLTLFSFSLFSFFLFHKMFLEAIFFAFEKNFSEFPNKIFVIVLHDIIGLQNLSFSFCKS